jgi:hypothetical protein
VLLTFVALVCSNITLARGSYARVLSVAMACAALSGLCLAVPFVRGPMRWRIISAVLALPVVFVVSDFIRRAPQVFGGG